MNGLLLAKTIIVSVVMVGLVLLVALGKATFHEAMQSATVVIGAIIVALGLQAQAGGSETPPKDKP